MKLEEDKIIDKVVKYNTLEKNNMKVLEECAELSEVIIKRLTKQPEDKPPLDKVIEEGGDLIVRLRILFRHHDIEKEVEDRIKVKLTQLDKWISEKYIGVV